MTSTNYTKKGRIANEEAYKIIENMPGLSLYEISNELNWSMGKTDGAITRLYDTQLVKFVKVERDGRIVKLVYPEYMHQYNVITIPKTELEHSKHVWEKTAFFYALDSDTFGVTGEPFKIWENISRFNTENKLTHERDRIDIEVPRDFIEFYKLYENYYSVSVNDNHILITKTGKIIT